MTWVNFQAVRDGLEFEIVLSHYGFDSCASGEDQVKVHCPFHDDSNPSCGINLAKKVFHCFSCQAKGNVLDFVARMEGFDPSNTRELRKAAIFACETFGIDGGSQEAKSGNQPKAKSRSDKSKSKAKPRKAGKGQKRAAQLSENSGGPEPGSADVSHDVEAPVASQAESEAKTVNPPLTFELQLEQNHSFLDDRKVGKEIVKTFGLGVAKRGSMKGRLCFPIHNEDGELIAYSGRWVDGDLPEGVPRYLLPKGFEKRYVLFNLNRVIAERTRLADEGAAAPHPPIWLPYGCQRKLSTGRNLQKPSNSLKILVAGEGLEPPTRGL